MGQVRRNPLALKSLLAFAIAISVIAPLTVSPAMARLNVEQASCGDNRVLTLIKRRFDGAQRNTFRRDITILEFVDIQQTTVRFNEPAFQDRLYCHGLVLLSNGRKHRLFYKLSFDGRPPLGAGLQWCVVGYDDYRAFAPACRQLKPL